MVLYLSFLQLASRCLEASAACGEHPMERNQRDSAPARRVNVVEARAPSDIRHGAPAVRPAGIKSASFRPPSRYKRIDSSARFPSSVSLFDLVAVDD